MEKECVTSEKAILLPTSQGGRKECVKSELDEKEVGTVAS